MGERMGGECHWILDLPRSTCETKGAGRLVEDASSEEGGDRRPRLDNDVGGPAAAPSQAAVAFATTEHFTLQSARASTIAESTGRATMFLGAVSGGLVALGLVATASRVGTAFYAFGLVLLPTLAFTGLVTFERVLQSGIEDLGYAQRIALPRGYYFDEAPELIPYLLSIPEQRQADLPQPPLQAGVKQHGPQVQGLSGGRWQAFRTVAGMVAFITAVLAGSAVGLLAAIVSAHSLAAALAAGGTAAVATLAALMRYQGSAWKRSALVPIITDQDGEAPAPAPKSS
jgi:hypothetical protein